MFQIKDFEKIDNSIAQSEKVIPTTMSFVDIAGLVKGASQKVRGSWECILV